MTGHEDDDDVEALPLGGKTRGTNSTCPSKYGPSASDVYSVRCRHITLPQSSQLTHGERQHAEYGM
jgi:hypothetical protein